MATELVQLPSGIPIVQVEISGYVASDNPATALKPTGMAECERSLCGLRGDRVPPLLGNYEAMARAESMATEIEEAEEWRQGRSNPGARALGHVFHVSLKGTIAVPSIRLASAMVRGTAGDVWENLRPFADDDDIHGIDLPMGRVIFREAQAAGHYEEKLMVSVPSLQFSGAVEGLR
jgi:hypothetical protein